ncbi:MAG: xanthine dehydrogenase family protein molybdopterin-binding subunit [Rhizobiales bacterium]|nr:xanthine dehydrogenase family protein molybdopterin-binding subunit [Hyphomicrobiales bacterium]
MQKFGMGQAVRRFEDERFIRGDGCYIDDIKLDGMAHAAFVRSPYAHAKIVSIDTSEAEQAPGVIRVLTHKDVKAAKLGAFPTLTAIDGIDENGVAVPPRRALTGGEVKYVGDPIAMVIAETIDQARDAAELVMVDYGSKPAVTDLKTVLDKKTPVIWRKLKSNRVYHFHKGDQSKTGKAIKSAHHVTSLELVNNRVSPSAVEPRGAIGDFDASEGQYVLHISGQAVFGQRGQMADAIFKVPHDKIRVVMPDVGGGFGAKNFVYPENVMVLLAAKLCGRPVKWIAERSENFLCEIHGRDHLTKVELALDEDGHFLALNVETKANMGAYLSSYATIIPTSASWVALGGPYVIPAMSMSVDAVFTNTVPVDAYRGAGRPEAAYLMERVVDLAAHEMGIDPLQLRQRNYIRSFPHKNALGMVIECGAFAENLELAGENAGFATFEERCKASRNSGRLRGRGVSSYLELTLGMPADDSEIRFDDDGGVTMLVGGASTGQGHETTYRQIINDELGIAPDKVRYLQGDTGLLPSGGGHGGSRSLKIVGSSLFIAAGEVRNKGMTAAAHVLEAPVDRIEFRDGLFSVTGTNRQIDVLELEEALRNASDLPKGVPASLTSKGHFQREANSFPNGVHIAEVEVDPETGAVSLERFTVVDDFGRIINPLIAEGQVAGGAVQGIGQAMLEGVVYDEDGQLISGSFMDYAMPRADDLSAIDVTFNQDHPSKTNPLGVKGAGEAGATGAPPAIVNAVVDALKDLGVRHVDMPLTPHNVWRAIQG